MFDEVRAALDVVFSCDVGFRFGKYSIVLLGVGVGFLDALLFVEASLFLMFMIFVSDI